MIRPSHGESAQARFDKLVDYWGKFATAPTAENDGYLRAKRDRLGHRLHPDDPGRPASPPTA
jgi:hypothetical protein